MGKKMGLSAVLLALIPMAATADSTPVPVSAPGPVQVKVTPGEFADLYANVCHLTINRTPGGTKLGSAVLYDGRYLLTAGHNVFQDRSRVNWIEVRCGAHEVPDVPAPCDTDPQCQRVGGWQGRDASGFNWIRFPQRRDFGMIRLNEPVAVVAPTKLVDTVPDGNATVRLAGYPGGEIDAGRTMYHAQASLDREQDRRDTILYGIDSATGNSGGPVWLVKDDGSYELLAIHIQPSRGRVVNQGFKDEIVELRRMLDQRAAERGVE